MSGKGSVAMHGRKQCKTCSIKVGGQLQEKQGRALKIATPPPHPHPPTSPPTQGSVRGPGSMRLQHVSDSCLTSDLDECRGDAKILPRRSAAAGSLVMRCRLTQRGRRQALSVPSADNVARRFPCCPAALSSCMREQYFYFTAYFLHS